VEERQFRVILSLLALVAVLVIVAKVASLAVSEAFGTGNLTGPTVQIVGFGLLPIAAIGLWGWQTWGFWTLGLSTAATVVAVIPEGLQAAIWLSMLHLTTILLVTEHYFARKETEVEEEPTGDHSH